MTVLSETKNQIYLNLKKKKTFSDQNRKNITHWTFVISLKVKNKTVFQ